MSERTNTSPSNLDDRYLERISALIDGEYDPAALLATVDFLVRSKDARAFYKESRELDGLLAGASLSSRESRGAKGVSERVDARVWSGIKEQVESTTAPIAQVVDLAERDTQDSGTGRPRTHPLWLLAAAVFAAVLGLASYELWLDRNPTTVADSGLQLASLGNEVEVGSSPDSMNDQRFFDLATELLEADRKYRKEMLALMVAVEEEPLVEKSTEESTDDIILRGGESDFGEGDESERGRVEVNFW